MGENVRTERKFKLDYRRRGQNRGAVECSRDEISRLSEEKED